MNFQITTSFARVGMIVSFMSIVWMACGSDASRPATPAATNTAAPLSMSAETRPLLAWADSLDGKTDQTLGCCVMCKYVCTGQAEFTSHVGPYTVMACSRMDKDNFEKDPVAALNMLRAAKQ